MSVYFHERTNGELLRVPYAVARDLAEIPASVWSFACCACVEEEGVCAECRPTAESKAQPPRRRKRWRFRRNDDRSA